MNPPVKWIDLLIFDPFCSDFDEYDFYPELTDEWMTSVDPVWIWETELNHQNQSAYQGGDTPHRDP